MTGTKTSGNCGLVACGPQITPCRQDKSLIADHKGPVQRRKLPHCLTEAWTQDIPLLICISFKGIDDHLFGELKDLFLITKDENSPDGLSLATFRGKLQGNSQRCLEDLGFYALRDAVDPLNRQDLGLLGCIQIDDGIQRVPVGNTRHKDDLVAKLDQLIGDGENDSHLDLSHAGHIDARKMKHRTAGRYSVGKEVLHLIGTKPRYEDHGAPLGGLVIRKFLERVERNENTLRLGRFGNAEGGLKDGIIDAFHRAPSSSFSLILSINYKIEISREIVLVFFVPMILQNLRYLSVYLFFLLSISVPQALAQVSGPLADPFFWNFDGEMRTVRPGGDVPIEINFDVPSKHHLYRDKMSLTLKEVPGVQEISLAPLRFSPSIHKPDPFTGKDTDVYEEGIATLETALKTPNDLPQGDLSIKLELTYQGCSNTLCYRLMRKEIVLHLRVVSSSAPIVSSKESPFEHRWFLLSLFLSFLGGLGSAFTPCVLPIIPITLAFIGVRKEGKNTAHNFVLSLFLVLSMALTYALLGIGASLLGKSLGFLYQNIYFLLFGLFLYVVFALSLFGLFEIQLPLSLRNRLAKMGGKGIGGAVVSGFTVGFLAAPCVGPLIGSLLLYVAERRNMPRGFLLLFSYGLGMGSLFLIIGTYYHHFAAKIHGGPLTVWIKRILAILLLIPAFYYGSIVYGNLKKSPTAERTADFWIRDETKGFQQAEAEEKPLFVDFYATWCLPCLEMEKRTFSNREVQNFLTSRFVPVKIDCTEETPQCKKMVERYGIVGWPTFLVLNPKGDVIEKYIGRNFSAEELIQELAKISGK